MVELLSISVVKRALIALVVAGALLPVVGVFSVLTKTSFFSAGISHIALAGIALAYLAGLNPIFLALLVVILASVLIWRMEESGFSKYEEVLSLLFSFFMALAILFFGLSKTYTTDAVSYLFGSPLTVTSLDLQLIMFIFFLYILVVLYFRREIFHSILSAELSMAIGINVSLIRLLLLLSTGIAVVLSMKVVGALVVFGLTVIPPMTAKHLSKHFGQTILISCMLGVLSALLGFMFSIYFDVPPGAAVVIISSFIYFVVLLIRK